uniref:Uncharacterized protein n=1 Tax=Cyprinus carpio TaxID=7962 RepID=A0A8C1PP91_CYPCA
MSSTDEPRIESGEDRNPGEVLHIRFQKNPNQKLKYLEAEPKILGVREPIALYSSNADRLNLIWRNYFFFSPNIACNFVFLFQLKACLGMQVVACMASVISIFLHISIFPAVYYCWAHDLESSQKTTCQNVTVSQKHMYLNNSETLVIGVHIALSATLAAYCCKVIQCCSPVSSVPVITVNGPPDPQ